MIIGIGGVSRAGKSSLAEALRQHFEAKGKTVAVFCQDDFAKPTMTIPKVQGVPDWERPSTIKWDTLTKELQKSDADIKIVEGLFAFYPASLRVAYDVKIFVNIEKETFIARRKLEKRWGKEPDWYADHVWRSYLKYGQKKGEKSEYTDLSGEEEIHLADLVEAINL